MAQQLPDWVMGATTLGMVCREGVILASEKRMLLGNLIISKNSRKVFKITENIGAACAGLTSDFQVLIRWIKSSANLYQLDMKRAISTRAAAKIMSNILFQRKMIPLITDTIVAGYDSTGPHLFTLDIIGSLIEDKYAAVGTGAKIAIGVLEAKYSDKLSINECKELAISAIKSASERDVGSGGGVDYLIIRKEGSEEGTVQL